MKKIAFITVRYGKEINGGAELHCKMLAERLASNDYHVEVLTTNLKSYTNATNTFSEGKEIINGVTVRRFKTDPFKRKKHRLSVWAARYVRSLRIFLYKIHILSFIANLFPVWKCGKIGGLYLYRKNCFYSSELFSFIKKHKQDYDVFIPITIDYPEAYHTIMQVKEKALLIPTMHYQKNSFYPHLTEIFTKAGYIGFNTQAEQQLAEDIFGKSMSSHGIISVGFEVFPPSDWDKTVQKYQLPKEYLLYVGRVDYSKLDKIFNYFLAYKRKFKTSQLKLVLVGGIFMEKIEDPNIIYTGFVEEDEKTAIINHAKIIINPSKYESLSLILLEALSMEKVMLANKKCNVMREHFIKSDKAIALYYGKQDFIKQLHTLDQSNELRQNMGKKGAVYVQNNYGWDIIMQRLTTQIENICNQTINRT